MSPDLSAFHTPPRAPATFRFGLIIAVIVLSHWPSSSSAENAPISFRLTLESTSTVEAPGLKQDAKGETGIDYSWRVVEAHRELSLIEFWIKTTGEGKESTIVMNRNLIVSVQDGKRRETRADQAPASLTQALVDTYGPPLCRIRVDGDGREVERTILAKPGARNAVESGLVANACLFHAPFLRDQAAWKSKMIIPFGSGGLAEGELTYRKTARPGVVSVTGVVSKDRYAAPDAPLEQRNVKYVISGEQTFDLADGEWKSGKLVMHNSFDFFEDEKRTGGMIGKMVLTLERIKAVAGPKLHTSTP